MPTTEKETWLERGHACNIEAQKHQLLAFLWLHSSCLSEGFPWHKEHNQLTWVGSQNCLVVNALGSNTQPVMGGRMVDKYPSSLTPGLGMHVACCLPEFLGWGKSRFASTCCVATTLIPTSLKVTQFSFCIFFPQKQGTNTNKLPAH